MLHRTRRHFEHQEVCESPWLTKELQSSTVPCRYVPRSDNGRLLRDATKAESRGSSRKKHDSPPVIIWNGLSAESSNGPVLPCWKRLHEIFTVGGARASGPYTDSDLMWISPLTVPSDAVAFLRWLNSWYSPHGTGGGRTERKHVEKCAEG
jgi:hypothetical protein